jgi:hypothetical protein
MPPFVATVFVLYLLSYAPMVRATGRCPDDLSDLYAPADWLLNHTALRDPMLEWSDAWGVRAQMKTQQERPADPLWFRNLIMSDKAKEIERRLGVFD